MATKQNVMLVLGGSGKTGRRVARRLAARGVEVRNARLADGVQRALGRPPRDFAEYARAAAATGVWNP